MIKILVNNLDPANLTDFLVGANQPAIAVNISTAPENASVKWTITPLNAESGTVTPNQGTNKQFTFTPNVAAARAGLVTGSRSANTAVGYRIKVELTPTASPPVPVPAPTPTPAAAPTPAPGAATETLSADFQQDEQSILRQEYVDFSQPPPGRGDLSLHSGQFNWGNYRYVVNLAQMQARFNGSVTAYRGRNITIPAPPASPPGSHPPGGPPVPPPTPGGPPTPATVTVSIPATAGVTVTSAYRNPRRNLAAGSVHPDSRHCRGHAIDMAPDTPQNVTVNGQNVALGLHESLYPALVAAAQTQGTAFTEHNATMTPTGDPTENHVHVQW
jgi:hypothetical protein